MPSLDIESGVLESYTFDVQAFRDYIDNKVDKDHARVLEDDTTIDDIYCHQIFLKLKFLARTGNLGVSKTQRRSWRKAKHRRT